MLTGYTIAAVFDVLVSMPALRSVPVLVQGTTCTRLCRFIGPVAARSQEGVAGRPGNTTTRGHWNCVGRVSSPVALLMPDHHHQDQTALTIHIYIVMESMVGIIIIYSAYAHDSPAADDVAVLLLLISEIQLLSPTMCKYFTM